MPLILPAPTMGKAAESYQVWLATGVLEATSHANTGNSAEPAQVFTLSESVSLESSAQSSKLDLWAAADRAAAAAECKTAAQKAVDERRPAAEKAAADKRAAAEKAAAEAMANRAVAAEARQKATKERQAAAEKVAAERRACF